MKAPLIRRRYEGPQHAKAEHGVTMVLVAVAMVAIVAIAALSIDVITLYLAREEAQRSADAAALAAARILSVSGITGDPSNTSALWSAVCGGSTSIASHAAQAVGTQNSVGGFAPTVTVSYGGGNGGSMSTNADCTQLASTTAFGVNPIVTVQIRQTSLPTFFSRIWGSTGNSVTATAAAEAFNSSNSGNSGNESVGTIIPVQPRCVKPWAVPNQDPLHPRPDSNGFYCNVHDTVTGRTTPCDPIVELASGSIRHPGISLNGNPTGAGGIIGETFWLSPDCRWAQSNCTMRVTPPQANYNNSSGYMKGPVKGPPEPPNLVFVPGQVGTPVIGIPSCSNGDDFEKAIGGCDAPTNYTCGLSSGSGGTNAVDLTDNPDTPTSDGVSCLIHQAPGGDWTEPNGQDYLSPFMFPSAYPFQILAGSSNPLVGTGLASGSSISASSSIVSLPIYDESTPVSSGTTTQVTFVGFLQVFINAVDQFGNVNITVLNVTGCGNGSGTPLGSTPVNGTSPVPVRLITPP